MAEDGDTDKVDICVENVRVEGLQGATCTRRDKIAAKGTGSQYAVGLVLELVPDKSATKGKGQQYPGGLVLELDKSAAKGKGPQYAGD
eukprot:gene5595-2619_t